jgi:hypothetical protein
LFCDSHFCFIGLSIVAANIYYICLLYRKLKIFTDFSGGNFDLNFSTQSILEKLNNSLSIIDSRGGMVLDNISL